MPEPILCRGADETFISMFSCIDSNSARHGGKYVVI
jgi:hypothetical protein